MDLRTDFILDFAAGTEEEHASPLQFKLGGNVTRRRRKAGFDERLRGYSDFGNRPAWKPPEVDPWKKELIDLVIASELGPSSFGQLDGQ